MQGLFISWYDIYVADLPVEQYRALAEFRFRLRQFLHFSEQEALVRGLEPQQHQALLALRGLPEGTRPTVGELAARMLIRHHSAVGLVDRLVRRGAVERVHGEADQREILLRLTPFGERLLRELSAAHREEIERTGPQLIRALNRVTRRARRSAA
jgi:DNA-binding MarR family transcriptional regulator